MATAALNVLVTGTSSGFGELTAKTLARAGHKVFASMRGVTTRNADAARGLREWAVQVDGRDPDTGQTMGFEGVDLEVVELDVADEVSVAGAVAAILASAGRIDVVVNNAGITASGPVEAYSIEQLRAIYDVNTFGPVRVDQAVLPSMRQRRSGLIIHVTSTLGRIAIPRSGAYASSKFALEALAEAMHYELAPLGVDAVILEPGAFPTRVMEKRTEAASLEIAAAYAAAQPPRPPGGARSGGAGTSNPQEVADAISALIEMPAGHRPLRTVVGSRFTAGVRELNEAYEASCKELLYSLGRSG